MSAVALRQRSRDFDLDGALAELASRQEKLFEAMPVRFGIRLNTDRCASVEDVEAMVASIQAAADIITHGIGDDPVTREEVSKHVALLIGSFPSHNVPEPKVFTRMMVEEVLAARPPRLALILGCRRVRRTKTFMPAIAEVLSAVKVERDKLDESMRRCGEAVAFARQERDRALREEQEREAWRKRRQERKAEIRKAYLDGDIFLRWANRELAEEVRREVSNEGLAPRPYAEFLKAQEERPFQ